MSNNVNFVKPFTNPEMISWEQFTTIVGGKFFSKAKNREVRTYGLLNSKLFDMDSKVQDHPKSPTYRELFDYTPEINSNGKPFRKWTRLTSLSKKQATWLIGYMIDLEDRPKDGPQSSYPVKGQNMTDPEVVPANDHHLVMSEEVASKSPEADQLPVGRYHLEGSNGFYVNVTKFKNGKYNVNLEY